MKDLIERPIRERQEHLLAIISSERFLKMQGLGNEVPFFICPFKPNEALEMGRLGNQLMNQLGNMGIRVLKINLYDLSIELLKKRGVWDRVLTVEETITKDELKELLQGVLDPESHLIPAIAEKMAQEEFEVMFITGATVMFFPGNYAHSLEKGASLDLFGRLQDDKYYRAFNIYHSQI
jgi:hypothetical protein